MEAGWYRYKSEWHFFNDGTIQPRFGFAAVQDSCTCNLHIHHAYWRLDFDVGGTTPNQVQTWDGTRWVPIEKEEKQSRDATHQLWRVVNTNTGSAYLITPGATDGTADRYGKGDFWSLKYNRGELDDLSVYTGTSANIDAFVNGESLLNQDIVTWYGVHFIHDAGHEGRVPSIIGPTLSPIQW